MKHLFFIIIAAILTVSCEKSAGSDSITSEGKGGSMARFAISGDVLYTVSPSYLKVFDIEDAANPKYSDQRDVSVGFDIETIFPMDTLLFIGSRSGMFVYDITAPKFPVLMSQVSHIRSCDPVVALGDYAYVTLNTNVSPCGTGVNNVLHIYDVSDPVRPVLKRTLPMTGPTGLGIDGAKLFVCDKGLKVFSVDDPINIRQIDDLEDIDEVNIRAAYDVIPVNGLLLLVAGEGLFQFDYTGEKIRFVSKITIKQ